MTSALGFSVVTFMHGIIEFGLVRLKWLKKGVVSVGLSSLEKGFRKVRSCGVG